ncbi:MAG: hypothetical protein DRI24_22945, partial [Deltaproteobacteria bacterium]
IVKGFDFGGSVDTHDLITKQPIKKHAKPFLIENSVRRFESVSFRYPKSDENFTAQLLGYIIDRVTETGRFVYKQQNEQAGDHFLDAVNLALVAYTLEKTPFGKPIFSNAIAMAPALRDSVEISDTAQKTSDTHRPKPGRGDIATRARNVLGNVESTLPVANSQLNSSNRLWSRPGWSHDGPLPERKKAFGGRRGSRPQRTKF